MVKYGSPEYWALSPVEKEAVRGTQPRATALELAKRPKPIPARKPEKKGFFNWLFQTPFWTPFEDTRSPPLSPLATSPSSEAIGECPRGSLYEAPLRGDCDLGYRMDKRWGRDMCICEARDPYVSEADKIPRDVGLGGLEGIVSMLPTLIVGGIIIAAISMLKK